MREYEEGSIILSRYSKVQLVSVGRRFSLKISLFNKEKEAPKHESEPFRTLTEFCLEIVRLVTLFAATFHLGCSFVLITAPVPSKRGIKRVARTT